MKVLLYSQFGTFPEQIENIVRNFNLEIVSEDPDVIITHGGDGTLVGAERDFPGVPKLPIKDSVVGYHTIHLSVEETLHLFTQNKLKLKIFFKLEASLHAAHGSEKKLLALNEVTIRNTLPNSALRFSLLAHPDNSALFTADSKFIGDGLVVSTPFGSSGYFYSITRKTFEMGIGLAFNNIHNINAQHQILSEDAKLEVEILRGPGQMASDNDPEIINLLDGDKISIQKSPHAAKIYTL